MTQNGSSGAVHDTMDPVNSLIQNEIIDPDTAQRAASDPCACVWVGASAGTGKTKVLTDRILRLLLPGQEGKPGTPVHKILCLTFTRAAANEMALRLARTLSRWCIADEKSLSRELESLTGFPPSGTDIEAARRLFARVIDSPSGLRIQTIHAFCQSVLGRFPLESGISPHFKALDETQAAAFLTESRRKIVLRAREEKTSASGQALHRIANAVSETQFAEWMEDIAQERNQFEALTRRHFGVEGLYSEICTALDVPVGATPEDILARACASESFDGAGLRLFRNALAHGTPKTDQPKGLLIEDWLSADFAARPALYKAYRLAFLTREGAPLKKPATKDVMAFHPSCADIAAREAARLCAIDESMKAAACALNTRDLLLLGQAALEEYAILKEERGALDFDDMILRTLALLQSTAPSWIMYKLDQGIDHILIDEAQDTNPEQWAIVKALADDFFSGASRTRTLFTVGDTKQSIYSFQRAAPDAFEAMQTHFARKAQEAQMRWRSVTLDVSFRSTPAVLRAVDAVFADPAVRKGLGERVPAHISFRQGQAGRVEIWPLLESPEKTDDDPWDLPLRLVDSESASARLAEAIAAQIQNWITTGEILESRDRPIEAGDILILMRTRSHFTGQLVRALKIRHIPVSGVDRMILNEQLAVQDLLAVAEFALWPADDLALACVLKSPFIGWDDDALFALAHGRTGSLWQALRECSRCGDLAAWLSARLESVQRESPYDFFARLLQEPCPADSQSGLRGVMARLGADALDPIDAFLSAALRYEKDDIPTVQGFIHWQGRGNADIKREMEEGAGHVRIMTVHGSKGLQAPIVILPDTIRAAAARKTPRLLWPDRSGAPVPLWSPRKADDCGAFARAFARTEAYLDEEYRRLLYVAMTRAEDRLYIAGYKGKKTASDTDADTGSAHWYDHVRAAFETVLSDAVSVPLPAPFDSPALRITNPQIAPPDRKGVGQKKVSDPISAPDWVNHPAPEEPDPPRPLIPSRPQESDPPARSPLEPADTFRFRRGTLTHALLQYLPDIPDSLREATGAHYLTRAGADLPDSVREDILRETLAIVNDPALSPLFGAGSLAEVPITGRLEDGRILSGQIDRLCVGAHEILVLDYKTNRPPPQDPSRIPKAYRLQMQAYAAALRRLYPTRLIRCALLWTDGPRLMFVPDQEE